MNEPGPSILRRYCESSLQDKQKTTLELRSIFHALGNHYRTIDFSPGTASLPDIEAYPHSFPRGDLDYLSVFSLYWERRNYEFPNSFPHLKAKFDREHPQIQTIDKNICNQYQSMILRLNSLSIREAARTGPDNKYIAVKLPRNKLGLILFVR